MNSSLTKRKKHHVIKQFMEKHPLDKIDLIPAREQSIKFKPRENFWVYIF